MFDSSLQKLTETGILGVLLVIALITIVFLYKENKKEREDRLNDLKFYSSQDRLFMAQTKETLENVLSLIRGNKQ
jgi:hypothetical protein